MREIEAMSRSELRGWAEYLSVEMPEGRAIELAIARLHHSFIRANSGKGASVPTIESLMTPLDPWTKRGDDEDDPNKVFHSFVANVK